MRFRGLKNNITKGKTMEIAEIVVFTKITSGPTRTTESTNMEPKTIQKTRTKKSLFLYCLF